MTLIHPVFCSTAPNPTFAGPRNEKNLRTTLVDLIRIYL